MLRVSSSGTLLRQVLCPSKPVKFSQRQKHSKPMRMSVSFSPEAQQLYQQLADQYNQIVNNGCFGTLSQIEEKMDCCKRFLEQWMEALCNKDFVPLLRNKRKVRRIFKGLSSAAVWSMEDDSGRKQRWQYSRWADQGACGARFKESRKCCKSFGKRRNGLKN